MEKITSSASYQNWSIVPEGKQNAPLALLRLSIQLFNQAWQQHAGERKCWFKAEPLLDSVEACLEEEHTSLSSQMTEQLYDRFLRQVVSLGLEESDEVLVEGMDHSAEGRFAACIVYEAIAESGKVGNPKKVLKYLELAGQTDRCRPLVSLLNVTQGNQNLSD